MRLLIFGGWGQLGTELAVVAVARHELIRPRHGEVDVRSYDAVQDAVGSHRPEAVVDLAAFHRVEACESDPGMAMAVNAIGAFNAARAAKAIGARVLYVSTDYVFGGGRSGYVEDDPVDPVNAYGVSKAAGEMAVRTIERGWLVVRCSGLFGHAGSAGKGGNFVDNILARARAGETLSVVDDQRFAPTAARDLAERIVALLEKRVPDGTYHAANSGACSWFELARAALEIEGVPAELLPRKSDPGGVRRPAGSVLLDTKSSALGLKPSRDWREALRWYLANRPAGAGVRE